MGITQSIFIRPRYYSSNSPTVLRCKTKMPSKDGVLTYLQNSCGTRRRKAAFICAVLCCALYLPSRARSDRRMDRQTDSFWILRRYISAKREGNHSGWRLVEGINLARSFFSVFLFLICLHEKWNYCNFQSEWNSRIYSQPDNIKLRTQATKVCSSNKVISCCRISEQLLLDWTL